MYYVGKDNTSIQHDKINRTKEWNTQEKQTPEMGSLPYKLIVSQLIAYFTTLTALVVPSV